MPTETKNRTPEVVLDLTSPQFHYQRALVKAKHILNNAEASMEVSVWHPAQRDLIEHFLAPLVITKLGPKWKAEAGSWGPTTNLQLFEVLRIQNIHGAIEQAKDLSREKLQESFTNACREFGVEPEDSQAQEIYSTTKTEAELLALKSLQIGNP